jgi:selenide,water dikinase
MKMLNKNASEAMVAVGAHACTDITGFGLLGHAYEMASGSNVTMVIDRGKVPIINGALDLARMGLIPAGTYRNKDYLKGNIDLEGSEDEIMDILFDPQTSGGLLISVPEEKAGVLLSRINQKQDIRASIIGNVVEKEDTFIKVK